MTIIDQLTDTEELERYAKDFRLISDYLYHRAWLAETHHSIIYRTQFQIDQHSEAAYQIWQERLPFWARSILSKELP